MSPPIIAIVCCNRMIAFGDYPAAAHQVVFGKYLDLVVRLGCQPVLVPSITRGVDYPHGASRMLSSVDGLLLTGSPSNVGTRLEGGVFAPVEIVGPRDDARDGTSLPLIRFALEAGIPILGICRGMQEINVALGGNLHQQLHTLPNTADHRSDKSLPAFERYGDRHDVHVTAGSWLENLLRQTGEHRSIFRVNSLHGQAVSVLGQGIQIGALADDGVVEAITVPSARSFAVGVQWHAEWAQEDEPLNFAILQAFQRACVKRNAATT